MSSFLTLFRRTATALGAIAAMTVTGATAQEITLSGATTNKCTYTGMQVTPNGDFTVTCSGTTSPGTFTLSAPTSISTGSTTTSAQVRIFRGSGSSGASNVPFTIGGTSNCSATTASPVAFADGDIGPHPIIIQAGDTAGNCVVTLQTPTAGALGTPSQVSKTIQVVDANADVVFSFDDVNPTAASVGGSNINVVVNRTGGSNNAWTVPVTLSGSLTSSGSIIAGAGALTSNPALVSGAVTFPAGSSSATFTFNPPDSTPASPDLPASLVISLGTPTSTTAVGQSASIGDGSHTITMNGPAVGCPTPETVPASLGTAGVLTTLKLSSGQIWTYNLPAPTGGKKSGNFKLSETSSSWPIAPWSYEIHINKCKGLIQPTNDGCYVISSNKTLNNKIYLTAFTSTFNTAQKIADRGWCYAPATDGPWYINIRYNYSGCTVGTCGWHAQWQNYAY